MSVSKESLLDSNQELCKSCGFCCDGTLFGHGQIEEKEETPAQIVLPHLEIRN